MIRDPSWYDANARRPWPLDETSSLLSDSGELIPPAILVDLSLRFPNQYGNRAWIGSLYVGPAAVSVLILAEDNTLLASLSLARSQVEAGRVLELSPAVSGAGGWIVLGEGAQADGNLCNLRFSTPEQSRLLPQAARSYTRTPVRSIGKLGAAGGLTGLVKLSAGNDISLVKETLVIDGQSRTAITINLANTQDDATRNLSEIYAGPCGGRPESRTCQGAQPIEIINTVQPDCCGTIFLELRGCAIPSRVQNDSRGLIIDCGVSLADACVTPDRLPDSSGRLPNEYQDQCDPLYLSTTTPPPEMLAVTGGSVIQEDELRTRSGQIDIIIPNSPSVATCTVVFERPHRLRVGEQFEISGNSQPYYDSSHTVVSIDNEFMLVSSVPYLADGHGGNWWSMP